MSASSAEVSSSRTAEDATISPGPAIAVSRVATLAPLPGPSAVSARTSPICTPMRGSGWPSRPGRPVVSVNAC